MWPSASMTTSHKTSSYTWPKYAPDSALSSADMSFLLHVPHRHFSGDENQCLHTEPEEQGLLSVVFQLFLFFPKLQSVCKDISYLVDPLNKVQHDDRLSISVFSFQLIHHFTTSVLQASPWSDHWPFFKKNEGLFILFLYLSVVRLCLSSSVSVTPSSLRSHLSPS